jgi:ArsR family transcriptional regulator, arsenate/arsenite/antimonite-responsive transcriptional repressor
VRSGTLRGMTSRQFQRISKAISDAKRYRMLERIAANPGGINCGEVRSGLGITAATCSHHIKELSAAGLIDVRRAGKFGYLRLRKPVWQQPSVSPTWTPGHCKYAALSRKPLNLRS